MTRDKESHRTYKVKFIVQVATDEGPATAIQCPGLPVYGDPYQIDADLDIWAYCRYDTEVTPVLTNEPNRFFECEFTFSTKPEKAFCLDFQQEDPLLIPPKLSGAMVKYTEEATFDRFGNPIVNSAWEQFRGPNVEFDKNRHRVHIEMNVPQLLLPFVSSFVDTVNAFTIWGIPHRCVKLSEFQWDRLYYGVCFAYYVWKFDFDVRFDTFDRLIADEGTKVLNGHWDDLTGNWVLDPIGGKPPDPGNPSHFMRFPDRPGNPTRHLLDGFGLPADVLIGTGTSGAPICTFCNDANGILSAILSSAAGFTGDYTTYQLLIGGTLTVNPNNPCQLSLTVAGASVRVSFSTYNAGGGGRFGIIFVNFSSSTDPDARYIIDGIATDASGKFTCCGTDYPALLNIGDAGSCPAIVHINATCVASPGPPASGGPGIRYVQKYDESDFSLIGIPLIL